MNFTLNPRFWFQKRTTSFSAAWAEAQNRMRYNALFMLDPDVLVRNLGAFAAGDICGLERILEDFENRDDKMKVGAFKMAAAVASKPWEVRIAKGEEDGERAKLHKEVLTRFWNRITVTDAFCGNRRGGIRTLVKQMMSAQSRVYAVHDVSWHVRGDGELEATFVQVPAWSFENRTGTLRYLKDPGAYTGVEMRDGEWLVTVGEGVGITAAIIAMAKRLSWNDWILFSEKCGMPVVLGNTDAKEDTPAWNALVKAIKAIAPKTGILADNASKLQAVPFGGSSGQATYRELVETVDRAISALYRGGDLATMSQGTDGVGSNSQDGESELMDADGCAMISETLQRQIERHVIRFTCGDFEPLAGIVINPPAETEDIDREIKIDMHLAGLGVRLSKADALSRYGRTEAKSDDDALEIVNREQGIVNSDGQTPPNYSLLPNRSSLPNETTFKTHETPFKISRSDSDGQGDGSGGKALLEAFSRDLGPAADEVKALLADLDAGKDVGEAAKSLVSRLPSLLPDDPAMAAVIAEEMAKQFGTVELANEGSPYTKCPSCGKFMSPAGNCEHCNFVEDDDRLIARGKRALERATTGNPRDVSDAMYRKGVGVIDFVQGWEGKGKAMEHGAGLLKIQQKHKAEMAQIPETIIKGTVTPLTVKGTNNIDKDGVAIINGTNIAILSRAKGDRWRLVTHYKSENDAKKITEAAKNATPA